jgi:adenylate kinase
MAEVIRATENNDVIIDGHYAPAVTPKKKVTRVFVLRRNPVQLREFMLRNGFNEAKLRENLASEILDVCLVEALQEQEEAKVCELDVTDKPVQEDVEEVMAILENRKKCRAGGIDWLGILEAQGVLDQYLKI